jgi:hypothetical protein
MTTESIHETVREHYAAAAVRASQGTSCCSDPDTIGANLYTALERDELPDAAVLASLGCGNPTARRPARASACSTSSGRRHRRPASAKRVGPPVARSASTRPTRCSPRPAQRRRRRDERRVPQGPHRGIPLPAESIDVVISNCVVNLADKPAVFAEIARVLRLAGASGSATSSPRTR